MKPEDYYFDLWAVRGFLRQRWYWHLKSAKNHEIVFSGQSRGYADRHSAIHGINIARAVGWQTEIQPLAKRER
jgi:uncharacterized protein YegP (UPF0339 family)